MLKNITHRPVQQVSLVGAGPGDPELMTLRAWHLLQQADVVLYDGLAGSQILDLLSDNVIKIYSGKRYKDGVNQSDRMQAIFDCYDEHLSKGNRIVRLKGGDPLIFSRTTEEAEYLLKKGVTFEIVPGVTSGFAGAALNGIPLTRREEVRNLIICTASTTNEGNYDFSDIANFLKSKSMVMIYMGGNKLESMVQYFMNSGIPSSTEICLLSNISLPEQYSILGTFKDIVARSEGKIKYPVLIVVGKSIEFFIKEHLHV